MEAYLLDWSNLLLRWLHVITAIAWVGSSFYFVFLDSSLTLPEDEKLRRDGATGEIWALHGGGFYHPVKYAVSPPKLPDHVHWFYWESYTTWLSGFALLTVSYLWNAGVYLVNPADPLMSPTMAVVAALAFLVVFWVLYDMICRIFGQGKNGDAVVGALVLVLVCIAAYLACHIFPGQAAFLLMGAMLATSMSANVFFWIIPGQRKVVASLKAGQPVDPIHGKRGKQRSVHNTYFTLPVVFAMLSTHYGWMNTHPRNWLVLILMMLAGALIRQFFVLRHGYKLGRNAHPWPWAAVGIVVLLGLVGWLKPAPQAAAPAAAASSEPVKFADLHEVMKEHCFVCHSSATIQQKGVKFDTPEDVKQHAQQIYQQVVQLRKMPFGNPDALSPAQVDMFKRWFEAGAHVDR